MRRIHGPFSSLVVLFVLACMAPIAAAQAMTQFDVPAQPLADALRAIGSQAKINVLFDPPLVAGHKAPALKANLTIDQALTRLLVGTGIKHEFLNDTTVVLAAASSTTNTGAGISSPNDQPPLSINEDAKKEEGTKGFLDRFRVAQVDKGVSPSSSLVERLDQAPQRKPDQLEEIIVTAQKREERIIDVPQSVSVLTSNDLAKLGATQFRDFANTVPGLSFLTSGAGLTQVSLRGVTTGLDISPTVGIYVDEVPYGTSTAFGGGTTLALDVGPFDLNRIEVLRGPQGTLYGASTMGGLIKYVSQKPDTSTFGGDMRAGISGTQDGGINYNAAGVVNVPIVTDKVALRANAFESHDGGYIDDLALNRKDVNRSDVYGGRLDLLVTPTDALSIRVTGFLQNISRDGEGTADYALSGTPIDGSLDQRRLIAERFDQRFRLVSGTVIYDFGPATLTSISSDQSSRVETVVDESPIFVPSLGPYSAVGAPSAISTDKFTQEVRLASHATKSLEWLIGGFYTCETSGVMEHFDLFDLAGQPAPNPFFVFSQPSHYEEYAAFGDLTWHLTNKLDLTGGFRYARNDQKVEQIGSGIFVGSFPATTSTDHALTYLANARYRLSEGATGYFRYATGYRPGGPNYVIINQDTGRPYEPLTFQSDKLKSYEVGIKAETPDRRFGLDVAGYYIDWSNIQISTSRGGFGFIANSPSGARVHGAALTLTARPTSAFITTGAFAYQNAYMKEADADLGASQGERLPNVPHFTAALTMDYKLPTESWQPSVGATLRYVSDRKASFNNAPFNPQYLLPDYTTVDLRTEFAIGPAANVQLFVHNLFDERGQLSSLFTNIGPVARVAILQPRTIGVTVSTKF